MKKTRRSLFTSIAVLLLCSAMFVGSTFAWFTDTVSNTGNRIQAGTLQVDLLMDKGDEDYVTIADGTGDIFKEADKAQDSNVTLWEPGKTQIVYLAVENQGNLALKYNIIVDITDNGLADSLEYAIIPNVTKETAKLSDYENWDAVKAVVPDTNKGTLNKGNQRIKATNGVLDEIAYDSTKTNERDYFALAVHMKETAGNDYQVKDIVIDVTLVAGQATAEEDGFGSNQYDKDAQFVEIAGDFPPLEDLFTAMSEDPENVPQEVAVVKPTSIKALKDASGKPDFEPQISGVTTTINLQDTLTTEAYDWSFGAMRIKDNSVATFKGNEKGKFVNGGANEALFGFENNGTLIIESGEYVMPYTTTDVSTFAIAGFFNDGKCGTLKVKGGTFKFDGSNKNSEIPFYGAYVDGTSFVIRQVEYHLDVEITGGKFYNCDPTPGLVTGFKAVPETVGNDIIYSVVPA